MSDDPLVVLDGDDRDRRVAEFGDDGWLSIRSQFRREGETEWTTWQDEGSSLSPAAVSRLAALLGSERPAPDADLAALRAEVDRLRGLLFAAGAMDNGPCFACGYGGPDYYQPEVHPCARAHHDAMKGTP